MGEASDNNGSEALVLVGYASLMESVQQFELTLKQLAVQRNEDLDGLSFDEAWRRVEKVLRHPMGPLQGKIPAELSGELSRLRRIRNQLAHEILLRWRLETNLGMATHAEVVDAFVEIANEFDSYRSRLGAAVEEHAKEVGLDPTDAPMSGPELRAILERAQEDKP